MDAAIRTVADPTRRAILDFAQERAAEITVDETADAVDIHRSVAFDHLELLADAGLLSRGERRGSRGRPARTYRYQGALIQFSYPQRQDLLLATILSAALAQPGALRSVRAAARRTGVQLVGPARGLHGALRALDSLGGRYEWSPDAIHACNCVFQGACLAHPSVCSVHAALIEGILVGAKVGSKVTPAGADGTGGCWYRTAGR